MCKPVLFIDHASHPSSTPGRSSHLDGVQSEILSADRVRAAVAAEGGAVGKRILKFLFWLVLVGWIGLASWALADPDAVPNGPVVGVVLLAGFVVLVGIAIVGALRDERRHAVVPEKKRWSRSEKALERVAPLLDQSRVVKLPEDRAIELRGRLDDRPVRARVVPWSESVDWEMQVPTQDTWIWLTRDLDKVPQEKIVDDDWGDCDEVRVFVARGIFVEGAEHKVQQELAAFARLPGEFTAWLAAEMERLNLRRLRIGRNRVTCSPWGGFFELGKPARWLADALEVVRRTAEAVAEIAGPAPEPKQSVSDPGGPRRPSGSPWFRCGYCSTRFVATTVASCPNCGAPAGV